MEKDKPSWVRVWSRLQKDKLFWFSFSMVCCTCLFILVSVGMEWALREPIWALMMKIAAGTGLLTGPFFGLVIARRKRENDK